MQLDRFYESFRQMVLRVLTSTDYPDTRALYPARVVQWNESGTNPSGTVDVYFEDGQIFADGVSRFNSKTAVPWLPPIPGQSCKPTAGTLVLVGWIGGDERFPYATGWRGLGGVSEFQAVTSSLYKITAPQGIFDAGGSGMLDVVGDLRSQHEIGASAGTLSASVTPTATLVSIVGDDTAFKLTVSCADATKAFTTAQVTLGRTFASIPRCVVSATDVAGGTWSTGIPSAVGTSFSTIQVKWNGSPLIGAGQFTFTVFVRG